MKLILFASLVFLCGLAAAAAPLVHGAMPPMNERPSEGRAIVGPNARDGSDETMNVCMIRVQFLEDFTDETTGNGRMNLEADPPHDRDYFQGIADDLTNYYFNVSGGELSLDVDIYPTSLNGCYTLQHQMLFYGDDDKSITGVCQLLQDAVQAADADVDFSQYDAVMVIHAGAGQEADILQNSPGDIGSVFLTLTDMIYYLPGAGLGFQGIATDDGVYVREGMVVPEQETQDGYGLGVLGTICHEFGHQLGLPDLYDTSTGKVGVGGWDLMGYGQWIMSGYWPSSLSAWSRIFLGWNTAVEVTDGDFSLAYNDSILKIPLNGTEYLLVENRQRDPDGDGMCGVDEHDFGLPGSGILIWHIDRTRLGSYVSSNMVNVDPDHKGVDLEEADGIQDFDYSLPDIYGYEGSSFDPWYQGGYAWEFSPSSEPSSDASWGGRTFVTLEVLDEIQLEMDVRVSRTTVCEGWPIRSSVLKWEPVIWSDPDGEGDRLVVTTSTGFTLAYGSDGSGPEPMGGGTTAPVVTGNLTGGSHLLLVCDDQGRVNLKDPLWNQPDGWPVTLTGGGNGTAALICEEQGFIAVADDEERVHMLDSQGNEMDGWPVSVQAPVVGMAVYADGNEPGLAAATMDGRLYLWNTAGKPVDGWPAEPGDEAMGIPLTADMDRDGSVEVAVLSGDEVFVYDSQGELLPGFPAQLPARPLSSPSFADMDADGILETVVITDMGVSAVGPSGATLEDWPAEIEQDSITAAFDPHSRGIGGSGFAMLSLGDGRICMFDRNGNQSGIFPVSAGDHPLGRPLLWDPEGNGNWRVVAADQEGNIYCWNTTFQPSEWFTGLDFSGSNCWWAEDLPERNVSTAPLRDGSFYVYPNPVQEGAGTIRFQPGRDCSWEIRVFNMGGDLVTFKTGSAPGGSAWEETWNTENLSPGVYFVNLRIISDQGTEDALFHAAVIN